MIVCQSEKSNQELRQEAIKNLKKIEESHKLQIRRIRNEEVTRLKKLSKIMSIDDVKRLSATVDEYQQEYNRRLTRRTAERIKEVSAE